MTYLLIIFVVALALAPLTHFVPGKRQREIAGMREYAAVHGLFVEFRSLPGTAGNAVAGPGSNRKDIIYYGKRLSPSTGKKAARLVWVQERAARPGPAPPGEATPGQVWGGFGRQTFVPPVLARLPEQVLAASVDEDSCGIYWLESGGEAAVEQIRQVLDAWSGQLRS